MQIVVMNKPIWVQLTTSDTPSGVVTDDWDDNQVYTVLSIQWANPSQDDYLVIVRHPSTGKNVTQLIPAGDSGNKNLPTPARFDSFPLETHCTLQRV